MGKTLFTALVCGLILLRQASAQEVFAGEQKAKPKYPKAEAAVSSDHAKADVHVEKPVAVHAEKAKAAAATPSAIAKSVKPNADPAKVATKASEPAVKPATVPSPIHKEQKIVPLAKATPSPAPKNVSSVANASVKESAATEQVHTAPATKVATSSAQAKKEIGAKPDTAEDSPAKKTSSSSTDFAKHEGAVFQNKKSAVEMKAAGDARKVPAIAVRPSMMENASAKKAPPSSADSAKHDVAASQSTKTAVMEAKAAGNASKAPDPVATKSVKLVNPIAENTSALPIANTFDTAFTKLADGFDFPVGKPDAQGYYKARGFRSHGHMGEDWDGVRGGDTDLGDPVYSIGDGLVVFARDCHMGWGNVIIVRHSYREGGTVKNVDALYGHLNNMLVHRGQAVARGQKIAAIGTAHGLYDAHLHLEIRKNLEIGMSRAAFAQDFSNYYDPSQFIQAHRHLANSGGTYRVAMNTFTRDAQIKWDKVRNYSHAHTGGGSSESAAALKRAVAAKH
jgi:murein DD-endopeptidase MepM/ murein hydrolase activator NlpD